MNFHPILVHFPVALLTLYAVIELASLWKPIRERAYVFYLKAVLAILGAIAAVPTFITGYIQFDEQQPGTDFYKAMTVHFYFAIATLIVFGILAIAYAAALTLREWPELSDRWKNRLASHRYVTETKIAPLLALIGLGAVTVTGAMGGALAYGPDVDPMVSILYHLFVK